MISVGRLPDEALVGDEALRDGIGRQEEAFQGHGSEQRGSARGDEAGRGHLSLADAEANLGNRPDLRPATGRLHGLGPERLQLELVGQRARNHEERGSGVHQQVERRRLARGTYETRADMEQPHDALILRPLHREANAAVQIHTAGLGKELKG